MPDKSLPLVDFPTVRHNRHSPRNHHDPVADTWIAGIEPAEAVSCQMGNFIALSVRERTELRVRTAWFVARE
jgi:hypothetical protein